MLGLFVNHWAEENEWDLETFDAPSRGKSSLEASNKVQPNIKGEKLASGNITGFVLPRLVGL